MAATTITAFEGNFGDDRNTQSIALAIANTSLTFINEQIAEAGLDELTALNVKTSAITAFLLDLGLKFEDMKQALKPKEKFRDLVEAMGSTLTFVNKLIRAAKVANNFPAQTAYMLGIDMLAQLAQSKYADLIDDFVEHPPENQLEASLRMKEWKDSQPKKPKTPWKYVGTHKTKDGLPREYQAPIVSETAGLIIEQESEKANLPPRLFVEQAVQAFVEPKVTLSEEPNAIIQQLQAAAEEGLEYKEKYQMLVADAERLKADSEELKEVTASNLEYQKKAQEVEVLASTLVEHFPVFLLKELLKKFIKLPKVEPEVIPSKMKNADRFAQFELASVGAKPKISQKSFALGDMVSYGGAMYKVVSLPDEDGDILCQAANGATRHLQPRFLKKYAGSY